jgi:hypothetical protein
MSADDDEIEKAFIDMVMGGSGFTRVTPDGIKHIPREEVLKSIAEIKVEGALNVIEHYGGFDGAHHKAWVIDQVARALTGDQYAQWVIDMKAGEDGPNTYEWAEGTPP